MFKSRQHPHQPQNPISDMEQFYLHQYFQTPGTTSTAGPAMPPGATQNNHRVPPTAIASLAQLEQRIARIEQHLGLFSESGFQTPPR